MNKHFNWLLILALIFQPSIVLAEGAKKDESKVAPAATSVQAADTGEATDDEWTDADDEALTGNEDWNDADLGDLNTGDEDFAEDETAQEGAAKAVTPTPAVPKAPAKKN